MRMYVGVTDYDWYSVPKEQNCDEVNFWKPGGKTNFKAINTNDMFLFKLHSPNNYIVGGGFLLSIQCCLHFWLGIHLELKMGPIAYSS